jgi:hypothetical protein
VDLAQPNDYNVLFADDIASVSIGDILDIDGQRQVSFTQHRASTSDRDVQELQGVLDSIRIER